MCEKRWRSKREVLRSILFGVFVCVAVLFTLTAPFVVCHRNDKHDYHYVLRRTSTITRTSQEQAPSLVHHKNKHHHPYTIRTSTISHTSQEQAPSPIHHKNKHNHPYITRTITITHTSPEQAHIAFKQTQTHTQNEPTYRRTAIPIHHASVCHKQLTPTNTSAAATTVP